MFIHIDLDCFFVSAHRTLDESLHNIPVAVGGKSNVIFFHQKKSKEKINK
jgi:DNA polymerase-4